jgi:hypothetical protein
MEREERLLRRWITDLPDELFDDVRSARAAVTVIKSQITARLLRTALAAVEP